MKKTILVLSCIIAIIEFTSCVSKKEFYKMQREFRKELESRPKISLTDSDQDGVIDAIDKELNTELGCPVNPRGEALDSDLDGIIDCNDEEPYSPPGYKIDSKGVADIPSPESLNEGDVNTLIDAKLATFKPYEKFSMNIDSINFPKFNIPPPPYSKIEKYEVNKLFPNAKKFGDVDSLFRSTLLKSGFIDIYNKPKFHYFQIKLSGQFRGYAIVTDFEKIDLNGKPHSDRFNLKVNKRKYKSIIDYIFPTRLNKGTFRFFAFLITDEYFGDKKSALSKNQAISELLIGSKELHPVIKNFSISSSCQFHVLVYEYEQSESDKDGYPVELDKLSVESHLQKANIWSNLKTINENNN